MFCASLWTTIAILKNTVHFDRPEDSWRGCGRRLERSTGGSELIRLLVWGITLVRCFFFFFFINHTPFDPVGLAGNKLSSYYAIYKVLYTLLLLCITLAFASRYFVGLLC